MTRQTTQLLARILTAGSVIVFARALATHHPDTATAAESAYLALVVGAVLGALVLSSRSTAAAVAAGLWSAVVLVLPTAGGTRGALVVAGLVAAVGWASWRSLATAAPPRSLDVVGVTLAWQALLRSAALITPPPTPAAVAELAAPALLLAAAAVHLGRQAGGWYSLAALAPLLLLTPGAALVPAAALVALAVAGTGRPGGWRGAVAVGGAAALALGRSADAGVPLLVLVAALVLRRPGWRWLPAAAAAAWAIARWSGDPAGGGWILLAVPFVALARRERWPTLATGLALAASHRFGVEDPALLAPAVALLVAAPPAEGRPPIRRAAWGLGLLALGCLGVAYPWLRRPFDFLQPALGLPVVVAVLAGAVLVLLAAMYFLSRWRGLGGLLRPAWLAGAGLVLLAAPLVTPVESLLGEPVVLSSAAGAWSATPGRGAIRRLGIDTFLMNGGDAADGSGVATVRLVTTDGASHEMELRLGTHTADWSARQLDRAQPAPWFGWVASDGSLAHRYRTDWRLDRPLRVARIEVVRADGLPEPLAIALLQLTAE